MSSNSGNITAKLLLLRDLDSVIDFSRASSQFSIILYLAERSRPVSVAELSRVIGDTRKSILDSLRKLEKKGLINRVESVDDLYVGLSEQGKEFIHKLLEVLTPIKTASSEILNVPTRLNVSKELVTSINLYRLLVQIGLSRRKYMEASEVGRIMVGAGRIQDVIIESFTTSPTRFFKVVKKGDKEIITLDKQGLEVLKKTPHYQAFEKNPVYRTLVVLTGTPWLTEIEEEINIALGATTSIFITGAILTGLGWLLLPGLVSSILIVVFNVLLNRLLVIIPG
jgi:DNA-binding MarR family transcriptional regulator